ncbi:MAG TPA: TrmH family RNA methyltransferase [Polyangiaceae bacterium]|nr:TrmH family RNA methyltransferase [Polyangiaceae bacterium]
MASVFLYAPQDFHNVCVLARTLEVFGQRECYVFDPQRLIRERYGKARSRELRVVSAGAFQKVQWIRIEEPAPFLAAQAQRVVATVADSKARALTDHRFSPTDLLLFGSESRGLPPEVVAASAAAVTIPARGQTRSLNLAVALGVVLFEWQRQMGEAESRGIGSST